MKRIVLRALTVFLAVLLLPIAPSFADEDYSSGLINADDVAFRKGPSTDSRRIRRLPEGTQVEILETNAQAEWHRIRYDRETGYVNQRYVTLLPANENADYQGTIVNVTESANVRSKTSKHSELLGTAPLGASYPILRTDLDGWHEIDYNGQTGYILDDYLALSTRAGQDQLQSLTVSGGTLLSPFSPNEYGYVISAGSDEVTITAKAADGVKVRIGESKQESTTVSMPQSGSKTIRISLNGKTTYSLYLVRNVLTVGTWNIKRGNGHLAGMSRLLQAQQPDLMGIQEVYRCPKTKKTDKSDNLLSIRTKALEQMQFDPTVTYESGGEYGIGMLSAYEIESAETIRLHSGTGEQRILQKIVVTIDGKKVSVYNTHMSYHSAPIRSVQFSQIRQAMDADENEYRILFGDFNAKASEFSRFNKGYTVLNTPETKFYGYDGMLMDPLDIDNIIVSDNITVLNTRIIDTDLSDHMPIFAYLRLD